MYYVSPFTYLVEGMLVTGLARNNVVCSSIEFKTINPPSSQTCIEYLQPYFERSGGYLREDTLNLTEGCAVCTADKTDTVLAGLSVHYSNRWRDFGILWAFIGFNICMAIFLYWLARVPKKQKVLDEPPTEGLSRMQSRVSRVQSRATRSEEKTTRSGDKATISGDKATKLEEKTTGSEEKSIGSEAKTTESDEEITGSEEKRI